MQTMVMGKRTLFSKDNVVFNFIPILVMEDNVTFPFVIYVYASNGKTIHV